MAQLPETSLQTEPNTIPEACPYQPGAILNVCQDGTFFSVRIKQTFRGGGGEDYYSNSCTVLVDVIDGSFHGMSSRPETRNGLILKIFDWRFSAQMRSERATGAWDSTRSEAVADFGPANIDLFQKYLLSPLTNKDRQHPWIAAAVRLSNVPSTPTRMDVFGLAMTEVRIDQLDKLVNDGLIPNIPSLAQREVWLQLRSLQLVAFEREIALLVANCPGEKLMPQVYGDFSVHFDGCSDSILDVYGILMERAPGKPITDIQNLTLTFEQASDIIYRIQLFQFQLWRQNIIIGDDNTNNFCIQVDGDQTQFMLVDYGGLVMIKPGSDESTESFTLSPIRSSQLEVPFPCWSYYSEFLNSAEHHMLGAIRSELESEIGPLYEFTKSIRTDCFAAESVPSEHTDIWYTVMDLLRTSDDIKCPRLTFERYLNASRVLRQGLLADASPQELAHAIRNVMKEYPDMKPDANAMEDPIILLVFSDPVSSEDQDEDSSIQDSQTLDISNTEDTQDILSSRNSLPETCPSSDSLQVSKRRNSWPNISVLEGH